MADTWMLGKSSARDEDSFSGSTHKLECLGSTKEKAQPGSVAHNTTRGYNVFFALQLQTPSRVHDAADMPGGEEDQAFTTVGGVDVQNDDLAGNHHGKSQ